LSWGCILLVFAFSENLVVVVVADVFEAGFY